MSAIITSIARNTKAGSRAATMRAISRPRSSIGWLRSRQDRTRSSTAPLGGLTVRVMGERAEIHPKVFTKIHVRYEARGAGLTAAQVERAVRLSQEKYCSVAAMLRPTVAITHETVLLDARDRACEERAG